MAQRPICRVDTVPNCDVDTTGWERIPTIQLDGNERIHMGCRSLDINSSSKGQTVWFWFNTCVENQKQYYDKKQNNVLDLSRYNFIDIFTWFYDRDTKFNYRLFRDKMGQLFLHVDLYTCTFGAKINFPHTIQFLVSKNDCPMRPTLCISVIETHGDCLK